MHNLFHILPRIALLARIAHSLTIGARYTYEVGTDDVLEPQLLRSYNELLHRVTGAIVGHVTGNDGCSLWKDADPSIPILKQAKTEYAKLR